MKCHTGCEQRDVVAALKGRGLWPTQPHRTVVAKYVYTDERSAPLYHVCRTEPKSFYQQRHIGGQLVNGLGSVRRVLYHLPEVIESPIVFLVEGEKDIETLRDWGFVATTAAGGAKAKWLPEYTDSLRGRQLIVIPDNDQAGWKRAVFVSRQLVNKVTRLQIFDLPEGIKDVTDWFAAGHTEVELIETLEATPRAV